MIKAISAVILILMLNNIFAQNFGLSFQVHKSFNGSYKAYTDLSISGIIPVTNKLEITPTFSINYSEPNIKFNVPKNYFVDVIDIAKATIGMGIYYYPITFKDKYSIFFALNGKKYFKAKPVSFLMQSGSNMIMEPGLYSFTTNDDFDIAISTGLRIKLEKGLIFIFDLGYQHRVFTFGYDKYDYNSEGWLKRIEEHSEERIINALNLGFGLQFMF